MITAVTASDLCWETEDAYTALMVRFIYNPSYNPLRLELRRPDPGSCQQGYSDYFQCEISYSNTEMQLALEPGIVVSPLPGASKELAQIYDKTAMQYLQRLDIVNRVRTIIVQELSSSAISKQRVSARLCMSPRSMQMKLAAKNTRFQEILDSTRRSLALGYLEQSALSITEAAYLLGFSEVSNFTRAFKCWTGKSPRAFRQALGIEQKP